MALLHNASLVPAKPELLARWLPTRPWYGGPADPEVTRVAACRLDDPADQVGIEVFVARVGDGPMLHTPMTYRSAPLPGGDAWLIGTLEHSVLGTRWVYDACGDPVFAAVLATTILTGGTEAEEILDDHGQRSRRASFMSLRGSGTAGTGVPTVDVIDKVTDDDPTVIVAGGIELHVPRVLDPAAPADVAVLTGTWAGLPAPILLAALARG